MSLDKKLKEILLDFLAMHNENTEFSPEDKFLAVAGVVKIRQAFKDEGYVQKPTQTELLEYMKSLPGFMESLGREAAKKVSKL